MINVTKAFSILATVSSIALLVACSDDSNDTTSTSTGTGTGASGGAGGGGGTSSVGSGNGELDFLATFDAAKGELPEGLAVSLDNSTAYVGFAPTGQIIALSLADNARSDFGSIPAPPMNSGFATGLAVDKAGDLYVGAGSLDAAQYQAGIYKIAKSGGAGTLFTKDVGQFPNGLVFDANGNLYSSDTASGSIYKTTPDGISTLWVSDPLLTGDLAVACSIKNPTVTGVNGIAISGADLFALNTDKALLVKTPIEADGTAGTPVQVVGPDAACGPLKGADGLITDDKDGSLLALANYGNALVHIDQAGKATTLVANDKLDSPASVVIATVNGKRTALITNFAIVSVSTGGTPHPGLLAYTPLR